MKLICALLLLTGGLASAQPVTGVVVRDLRYDPHVGSISYVLINQSSKRAVAWTMREHAIFPGGRTQAFGMRSTDMGRMPPPPGSTRPPGFGPLEPNEIRKQVERASRMMNNGVEPVDFRLEMLAVLYEDGSAEGDPKAIEEFRSRYTNLDSEHQKWLPRIKTLLEQPDLRGALRQLFYDIVDADAAALKASFDKPMLGRTDMDARNARTNLMNQIRGVGAAPDSLLRQQVEHLVRSATTAAH